MRVPYEWLKDFVDIDMDHEELARRVTMRGLEVEAIDEIVPAFEKVIAGKIATIEKHPDAGNLSVCKVDTGERIFSVVCGAGNIRTGDLVPLATAGSSVGGIAIENRVFRGVSSEGMLCSERELGLSDDHSGIFILPANIQKGTLLEEVPGIRDVVFDINVPPNRGDLLSVFGIAREVAGIVNAKVAFPATEARGGDTESTGKLIDLQVIDAQACPRYVLKIIRGISIGSSPFWMRNRIIKCGMRPINAIVDITNYIMIELGQPLHAFDYNLIREHRIDVRLADREMLFRTLDGTERKIVPGDLLICDGQGPVALAGIMGGENSEITPNTKDVALESAFFNPYVIRKTARRLGIKSEASLRFEKGIDIGMSRVAAERAIALMKEFSGGTVVKETKEAGFVPDRKTIMVDFSAINNLIGVSIEHEEIRNALQSIDIGVLREDKEGIVLSVPHFRHDIEEPADIVEEIARIHGYDFIPSTMPVIQVQPHRKDRKEIMTRKTKNYFFSAGFFESINFAFCNGKDIENFSIPGGDERACPVKILNPISKDYELMRTFLMPNLIRNVAYNCNRGEKNLRLFEMGKVFFETEDGLPHERIMIGCMMTGSEREYFWREGSKEYDFIDIKGVIDGYFNHIKMDCSVERSVEPFIKEGNSADFYFDKKKIGWAGELRDEILGVYDVNEKVFCAELQFDLVVQNGKFDVAYKPIPRFPQVVRDFSFTIDKSVPVIKLTEIMKKVSPLVVSVGVFDVFTKDDTRSVSFRVTFQSYEDTLKDEEVNRLQGLIIKEITNIDGVMLR